MSFFPPFFSLVILLPAQSPVVSTQPTVTKFLWPGLFQWASKYHDGTAPDEFVQISAEDEQFIAKAVRQVQNPSDLVRDAAVKIGDLLDQQTAASGDAVAQAGFSADLCTALSVIVNAVQHKDQAMLSKTNMKLGERAVLRRCVEHTHEAVASWALDLVALLASKNEKVMRDNYESGLTVAVAGVFVGCFVPDSTPPARPPPARQPFVPGSPLLRAAALAAAVPALAPGRYNKEHRQRQRRPRQTQLPPTSGSGEKLAQRYSLGSKATWTLTELCFGFGDLAKSVANIPGVVSAVTAAIADFKTDIHAATRAVTLGSRLMRHLSSSATAKMVAAVKAAAADGFERDLSGLV